MKVRFIELDCYDEDGNYTVWLNVAEIYSFKEDNDGRTLIVARSDDGVEVADMTLQEFIELLGSEMGILA